MFERKSFAVVALVALTLSLTDCRTGPRASESEFGTWTPNVPATPEIAALEKRLFALLNRDRKNAGLGPLSYDERLADIARFHSKDMQVNAFFGHESPKTGMLEDRMVRAGYLATEMRENVAQAASVESAAKNLLDSPGHRKNILSTTVTHVGIGIVKGDSAGDERALLVTQVFASRAEVETPAQALEGVRRAIAAGRKTKGLTPLQPHPVLTELAEEHIGDMSDEVSEGDVSEVGDKVSAELNNKQGHGLSSIGIAGQRMFGARDFVLPGGLSDPMLRYIGMAAAEARDEKGRPRVKVLVLLGRAAR
jgi:uncharacterized protein YkwD